MIDSIPHQVHQWIGDGVREMFVQSQVDATNIEVNLLLSHACGGASGTHRTFQNPIDGDHSQIDKAGFELEERFLDLIRFRRKGDPRGCVGEVTDPSVKILNERGEECPLATLDADGKITNYADAVGEICRVAADTGLFQGYFDNPNADTSKFRDGVYHSGDLGHIVITDGVRYLYFDGRTDDWIRKDGENFSAAQIARILSEHPAVELAAAYGVPCAVSDELVMAALQLKDGARFDPKDFFEYCEAQITGGGMDRKWFPDFVRLVDDFEYTQTQKVLVRNYKKAHFDRNRVPEDHPLAIRGPWKKPFTGRADTK